MITRVTAMLMLLGGMACAAEVPSGENDGEKGLFTPNAEVVGSKMKWGPLEDPALGAFLLDENGEPHFRYERWLEAEDLLAEEGFTRVTSTELNEAWGNVEDIRVRYEPPLFDNPDDRCGEIRGSLDFAPGIGLEVRATPLSGTCP